MLLLTWRDTGFHPAPNRHCIILAHCTLNLSRISRAAANLSCLWYKLQISYAIYLNTLTVQCSDLDQKNVRCNSTLYEQLFWKKCGSYHSKNFVLDLEKPLLVEKSAREEVFRGLKQCFLSGKTQIFFKKAVNKELNYIWKFFGQLLSIISVFK